MTRGADPHRDPRAFCGTGSWPLIEELADGDEVVACYIVQSCRRLTTRNDKPYLRLVLGDRTGTIDGVIWEEIDRWEALCAPKAVIGVHGRVSFYQDRPQLRIESVETLLSGPGDLELLLPASPRNRELMERELEAHIASVRDRALRSLLRRCLGHDTELGRSFREHPAATRNHHAYLYGLLEHTLSVTGLCQAMVEHYREQGVPLDRDLLITGALLHDIGKVRELDGYPAPSYTTAGKLIGHIMIGVEIVGREGSAISGLDGDRLLLVQHLIASHQGKPEWDSRHPQTREALVLHYADDLDAKMNQAGSALSNTEPGQWSDYDRSLGRSFYLPPRLPEGNGSGKSRSEDIIDLFEP